jgi:hypothetical protein
MATEPTTGPITGSGGTVVVDNTELNDVRNWRVNRTCDIKEYNTNQTGGFTRTGKGNRRWEGNVEVYLEQGDMDANPVNLEVGDFIKVKLTTTGVNDKYLEGFGRVSSIDVACDIEGNEFEGATINFTGHAGYTIDSAVPTPTQ